MKLIPVNYYGFTAMDRRFSSPMLPWIVSEIRKRDYCEKLSLGIEDGILQAYNLDFELQFSHKIWQLTRFSQADQDPTTFLYLMRDDNDTLLYCYLFQAKKAQEVLLKIDEVLDTKMKSPGVKNPSAFDFLQNYYKWDLGYGNEVGIFSEKVKKNRKLTKLYASEGFSTFFVPVDGGLDYPKLRELDRHIIEGHIIPNHVLFTRPAEKNFVFDTLADSDFLNIVLTLEKGEPNTLVKSSTIFGSAGHRKGEVVAEIVVPNIPVSNGVIHLISRPLGIFKRELTVFPLLSTKYKIESDPEISLTSEYGKKSHLNDFLSNEEGDRKLTYFVPNDRAWKRLFAIFGSNPLSGKTSEGTNAKIREILGRHLIVSTTKWFKIDDLVKRSKNFNNETVIGTASGPMRLQFVKNWDDYHILWNGKRINVIRADYECLDGIVHIIDGVFVDLVEFENIRTREEGGFWAILKDMVRHDRDSNN